MFQINQNLFFREFETQLVVTETEQTEPNVILEHFITQPAKNGKPKTAQKSKRLRSSRSGDDPGMLFLDFPIEPCNPFSRTPAVSSLSAPLHTHLWVEGEHVGFWWDEVDGAVAYELWVCPRAFEIPEQPAECLYRGLDHAFLFPVGKMIQPGYYHLQARAVDAAGRPGGWSSEKTLPLHIPVLDLEVVTGLHPYEISLHWKPVESAIYYEIQMDQRLVCSCEAPSKRLENIPVGLHSIKVRPVFSGGSPAWEDLPAVETTLESPLEITPQEVSIFWNRDTYVLHWYCPDDATLDSFAIIDPDHDRRVLGNLPFQKTEKNLLGNFFRLRRGYRWPIPLALQMEGQRFAVQAVKGNAYGPVSDIATFPRSGKSISNRDSKIEVDCSVGNVDSTLREFIRKKLGNPGLNEQRLEIYDDPSHLRQYSVYHCPVLQAMNLQPRMNYRLWLTMNNGQLWQVEIIFNPETYQYNLTFQRIPGS